MFINTLDLTMVHSSLLAFGLPSGGEWIILLVLGLLIFGKRLPEVGRSLGRGIVEFKKGIHGIEDEIDEETRSRPRMTDQPRQELPRARTADDRMDAENPYAQVQQRPADK